MPRPTKAFNRTKQTAAEEYKKGNRKEAYVLWAKAAQSLKDHREKKRHKDKGGAAAEGGAAGGGGAAT